MGYKEFNELSLDELEQVAGGETYVINELHEEHEEYFKELKCPICGSRVFPLESRHDSRDWVEIHYKCSDCGHEFTVRIKIS